MISIIIPLMPVEPWKTTVGDCIYSISKSVGAEYEVILQIQEVEKYINKNKLLNDGFAKAKGDIIWHCDADFLINETFLRRMEDALIGDLDLVYENGYDVIWPMFYSNFVKGYKASDGGPFMKREVLEKLGPLDESLIGISLVTFPFMKWCLENVKHYASTDLTIELQPTGKFDQNKVDAKTFWKNVRTKQAVVKTMKEFNYWGRQKHENCACG